MDMFREHDLPSSIVKVPGLTLGGWLPELQLPTLIFWVLRIAISLNFLFHGAWGVVGKEAWFPLFDVAGIGPGDAAVL